MANEKRLIFVDAVLTGIATFKECYEGAGLKPWILEQIHTALQMVKRFVKEYPTVDAVEVIRCKDCKHFVQGEPYDPCECMKWKVKWGAVYTTPDGYCHKGERKDNG
jgi:hypothetical protein